MIDVSERRLGWLVRIKLETKSTIFALSNQISEATQVTYLDHAGNFRMHASVAKTAASGVLVKRVRKLVQPVYFRTPFLLVHHPANIVTQLLVGPCRRRHSLIFYYEKNI